MSRNRKKGNPTKRKQSNPTVADPTASTVSPTHAQPDTTRKRFLSIANTNLGGNIVGGILILLLTVGISYQQSRASEERSEREKRHAERVALTNEISPWLILLWVELRDLASLDFVQESDSSLTARSDRLRRFGFAAETPVLAARISEAFSDSIRDVYLDLLKRNAKVEYALRLRPELRRADPPSAELGQAAKQNGWTIAEWNDGEERKLQEGVPAKVDTIMRAAYHLGNYLRAATFGPQPAIFE